MYGGEAAALGELSGELSNLQWSPDGTELSVLRRQPETKKRKKRNEKRDDAIVVDGEPRYNRLTIVDAETGKSRKVDSGDREIWDYAWSLDGSQLAYSTAEQTGEDAPMSRGDIWLVDRDGDDPRHIVQLNETPMGLAFVDGPNGIQLAIRKSGFREHPAVSVYLVDLETGAIDRSAARSSRQTSTGWPRYQACQVRLPFRPRKVCTPISTASMFRPVSGPLWYHDRSRRNGALPYPPSVSNDGSTVAALWSASDVPEEIYLVRDAGEPLKLTDFGKDWVGKLRPSEEISWMSDDLEIFGLLTLPEREDDKPLPLVVQIHGGPSWQWQDMCFLDWHDWTQYLVSRGFAVLAPNPRGSTGRGSEFQRRLIDDVGGGEMRDVIAGAQALVDRGIADPERLGRRRLVLGRLSRLPTRSRARRCSKLR